MKFVTFLIILAAHTSAFSSDFQKSIEAIKSKALAPSQNIQKNNDLILKLASEIAAERLKHDLFQVITTIELSAGRPRPIRRNETDKPSKTNSLLKCNYEESNFSIILEVSKNHKFLNRDNDFTDADIHDTFNLSDIKCEIIG